MAHGKRIAHHLCADAAGGVVMHVRAAYADAGNAQFDIGGMLDGGNGNGFHAQLPDAGQ